MCKCISLDEHSSKSRYVQPVSGDDVLRYRDDSGQTGLLYHVDAYDGGLPRGHVVYDDGTSESICLFLLQSPDHAAADPCWSA